MQRRWDQSLKSSVRRTRMEKQFTSWIWWTFVTSRTPILQNTSQKYKERVVHLQDNEEGHRAVVLEQGASASQMAAAEILDTISKLFGVAGETTDAISSCTQGKMTEAPRWLPMLDKKMSCIFDHNFNDKDQKVAIILNTQWDFLKDIHIVTHWPAFFGEENFEEVIFEKEWGNLPTWECLHAHKKLGLFSSVNVDDVKMLGKKQNIDSIWKTKQKDTDLERNQPWRSNAILGSRVLGMHAKSGEGWSSSGAVQNRVVQEIDNDTGGWRKRLNERKTCIGKDHCLELWYGRSCREMRWKILRCDKKMYLLSNKWQHHAFTITWFHWKTMKQLESSLQYVLRVLWNVCIWQE